MVVCGCIGCMVCGWRFVCVLSWCCCNFVVILCCLRRLFGVWCVSLMMEVLFGSLICVCLLLMVMMLCGGWCSLSVLFD